MSTKGASRLTEWRRNQKKGVDTVPPNIDQLKEELKELVQKNITPLADEPDFGTRDDTLNRFLKARGYNVNDAYKQLSGAMEWRRTFKPLSVKCSYCHDTPGFHALRQVGFDLEGRPLMYACFAQCQTLKNSADDIIDHVVYVVENAWKSVKQCGTSFAFVIDCTGLSLGCCNPKIGKKFVQTFADCYPETLYKFILVHHSSFFHGIWKAIKVFVDPVTKRKVKLLKKDKIAKAFYELFDTQTANWLLEELDANKDQISESQLRFWDPPSNPSAHDPRGTPFYVANFVTPLKERRKRENVDLGPNNLDPQYHIPHPNIMDAINGRLTGVTVKSLNMQRGKPNEAELAMYGVNAEDISNDLSDQESE